MADSTARNTVALKLSDNELAWLDAEVAKGRGHRLTFKARTSWRYGGRDTAPTRSAVLRELVQAAMQRELVEPKKGRAK